MNVSNYNPFIVPGEIAGRRTQLLIDSGASLTLINLNFFNELPKCYRQTARPPPPNLCLQLADRSQLYVKYALLLPITISNSTRTHKVYVVPKLWRACIIGNDLIRKHNLQIDGGRQHAYFKKRQGKIYTQHRREDTTINEVNYILLAAERVKIPPFHVFNIQVKPNKPFSRVDERGEQDEYEVTSIKYTPCAANGIITPSTCNTLQVANLTNKKIIVHTNQPLAKMTRLNEIQINTIQQGNLQFITDNVRTTPDEEPDLVNTELDKDQKEKIQQLIKEYPDVFNEKTGRTKKLQHQINVTPESTPYNSPPFRYAPARKKIIEENINEMLEQGIISPSHSPWASPVILVPKKDGSLRFCVDYRKLNTVTTRDAYPLPRIDDTLDSLQEAKFISTLDLRSGYWQVEMDKKSREKTAFVTHKGLFEFNVMPFGLMNAPATFQRLMDIVLAGVKWQCCLVYIDDVVIFSPTFEQHVIDLRKVFEALRSANLTAKLPKCQFCRREMKYLGHVITPNGIKPDPELTKAVRNFPEPKKIKDVQSFLGLTGYYRRFIKDYAKIAEPMFKQLRHAQQSNNQLKWSNECRRSFEMLKTKLTNAPIMHTPNFDQPFILELDACEYGLGAVLTQEYEKKKFVIAYASRTLSTAERKYGATEREALAIVWATKHFRPYLEGNKIYIRSDCKALEWMRTAKDVTGRIARWAIKLSAYQIEEIKYRPGKSNANADSLSRNPLPNEAKHHEVSTIETAINVWEDTNILNEIKEQQRADPKLKNIIQLLESKTELATFDRGNQFVLLNGILHRTRKNKKHYNQRLIGEKQLLVIPSAMQNKVLEWAHDHPTAGHGGQQRTLYRLGTRVYWESMRKDVINYIASCNDCQRFKYNNAPTANPMQLHIINEPWHTIGMDIMGPFPTTAKQKRFLLVVVDYFTRWVELFPMNSTTSTSIANILTNEVFARYGFPKYILSDNGPQFVSDLFKNFCETLGIERKFTSNYHPQSNMTERVNRTLKPLIAIYAQNQSNSWDKEIHKLAFALRTAINETTGETPAFMMFGRDPRGPLDLITSNKIEGLPTTANGDSYIQEYKTKLINNLRCAYKLINEHAEIEKIRQKEKYDRHTTTRKFMENDLVWITIPTAQVGTNVISGKLQPRYQGPCRLIKQLSANTFTVIRLQDNVNLGAVNIDRMKLYVSRSTDQKTNEEQQKDPLINKQPMPNYSSHPQDQTEGKYYEGTMQRRVSNRRHIVPMRYRD